MEVERIRQCYGAIEQSDLAYQELFVSLSATAKSLSATVIKKALQFPWESAPESATFHLASFAAETAANSSQGLLVFKCLAETLSRACVLFGTQPAPPSGEHPQSITRKRVLQVMTHVVKQHPHLIEPLFAQLVGNFPHKSRPTEAIATFIDSLLSLGLDLDVLDGSMAVVFANLLDIDGDCRPQAADSATEKMRVLLSRVLEWAASPFQASPAIQTAIFASVLTAYERVLLKSHNPKLLPCLLFNFLERGKKHVEGFVQRSLQLLYSPDAYIQRSSAIFLCSYLQRSRTMSENVAMKAMAYIVEWLATCPMAAASALNALLRLILCEHKRWSEKLKGQTLAFANNLVEVIDRQGSRACEGVMRRVVRAASRTSGTGLRMLMGSRLISVISAVVQTARKSVEQHDEPWPFDFLGECEITKGLFRPDGIEDEMLSDEDSIDQHMSIHEDDLSIHTEDEEEKQVEEFPVINMPPMSSLTPNLPVRSPSLAPVAEGLMLDGPFELDVQPRTFRSTSSTSISEDEKLAELPLNKRRRVISDASLMDFQQAETVELPCGYNGLDELADLFFFSSHRTNHTSGSFRPVADDLFFDLQDDVMEEDENGNTYDSLNPVLARILKMKSFAGC